ncbi:Uncharacterised protein [Mycobacterium tuberculosis]|uniref:Uncharacterized protein n=1 Tax=Mycobacterium tuberculosis TaxID=1773 RepID=A0A654TKD7_MYCTX|nr:Uncharacterised protein [Mycobacterium tuberculosis]CKP56420.1 Uncharacterised protein [Mycobacterium tuberculosis]CKT75729.1 Uncharacterised protein [Mycobacterium tuberculosis]CNW08912.1 Uncharacterised protein [Mycobacterium tuberculosis]
MHSVRVAVHRPRRRHRSLWPRRTIRPRRRSFGRGGRADGRRERRRVSCSGAPTVRPPKCCRRPLGEQLAPKRGRHPSRRHRGVPGSTRAGFAEPAGLSGPGCGCGRRLRRPADLLAGRPAAQRSAAGPHRRYVCLDPCRLHSSAPVSVMPGGNSQMWGSGEPVDRCYDGPATGSAPDVHPGVEIAQQPR